MREESPLGLMTVRESPERAQGMAVSGRVQADLLKAAAIVPVMRQRIDDGRDVRRLQVRLDGADLSGFDLDGVGQRADGQRHRALRHAGSCAVRLSRTGDDAAAVQRYLAPSLSLRAMRRRFWPRRRRPLATPAVPRRKAERLTRYVNALLEKKPTVSLPSAREVLRTKVGDCNEHTALYVAMARSIGFRRASPSDSCTSMAPSTTTRGPRSTSTRRGRGFWLPVDPTFNQFPADATHLRLARGGLDKQAAILPLIGRSR